MSDSPNFDALDEKHERNRVERLEGVVRWAEYVKSNPADVWGPQQNQVVNSQVEGARATDLTAEHEQRVRAFAQDVSDGPED
jgi:hypothetical protein